MDIAVEYYNDKEKDLFKAYPNSEDIENKIKRDIKVSEDEFLAYMMFIEQKNEDGFRTYEELKNKLESRKGLYEDYLNFENGTVNNKYDSANLKDVGITERMGISLGLNVANQLHDLTEADWAITSQQYYGGKKAKDFDYELPLAATKNNFIQVENKGSVVDDNSKKTSSVSQHYNSIKAKKTDILRREKEQGIPRHENIYYGTIGVVDSQNKAKVYLVDPPPFDREWSPLKHKLIARLSFYHQLFIWADVKGKIVKALHSRIEELIKARDVLKWNKKRLEKINIKPNSYINNKRQLRINTREAFGTYYIININGTFQIYIIAIPVTIIKLILNQDFNAIIDYEYNNAEMDDLVSVELFDKSKEKDIDKLDALGFVFDEKRNRFMAQFNSRVRHTTAGRIYGVIGNR